MKTKLSVNINKIATIRNARGGNTPNVVKAARDIQQFGADGITIHPRPDQRHIRFDDVYAIKEVITTEYNIEGYPSQEFIQMVLKVKPDQVTLVPDPPDVLTSNNGWDTIQNEAFLSEVIQEFKKNNIRTSVFLNPDVRMVDGAKVCGADRIELYTESFASGYPINQENSIAPFIPTAIRANELGLGINAGHDLSLENLNFFAKNIPGLLEVSIGHALISDALYFGLENTVNLYQRALNLS
jgi:pyridoxine 5-phosphate synthase